MFPRGRTQSTDTVLLRVFEDKGHANAGRTLGKLWIRQRQVCGFWGLPLKAGVVEGKYGVFAKGADVFPSTRSHPPGWWQRLSTRRFGGWRVASDFRGDDRGHGEHTAAEPPAKREARGIATSKVGRFSYSRRRRFERHPAKTSGSAVAFQDPHFPSRVSSSRP
jgi:hypothetical protein